jgi:hypothetical protein
MDTDPTRGHWVAERQLNVADRRIEVARCLNVSASKRRLSATAFAILPIRQVQRMKSNFAGWWRRPKAVCEKMARIERLPSASVFCAELSVNVISS